MTDILKNKRKIFLITAVFFLVELVSFLSYYFPLINQVIFFLLVIVCLGLACYKLRWALYFVFAELFLNSMGYIFFLESGGLKISLRISLWLIVIAVFLAKILLDVFRKKDLLGRFLSMPFLKNILYLGFFVVFGLVLGILNNGFSDAFFDFNAWLYFLLIFPVWLTLTIDADNSFKNDLVLIFVSSTLFLLLKSLILLFLFSHNFTGIISDLYYWTRSYSLGEITAMGGGLYRIFLQSQIFIMIAFLISSIYFPFTKERKQKRYLAVFMILSASVLILSFSRSFWLAAFFAVIIGAAIISIKFNWKKSFYYLASVFIAVSLGFAVLFAIINLPLPSSNVEFDIYSVSERANIRAEESAISSRWALLSSMQEKLKSSPILGKGFGARIEYQSSDPRVLERTADGIYSTYAFEWGWLDIWLKIGLLGLISYLLLIFLFLKKSFSQKNLFNIGLGVSIFSLVIVNIFTPYLNHPLGIGFLILALVFNNSE